jgi:hypothetical protein
MSKSGLYAHFGSKAELQLATVEEADRIFQGEVVRPARAVPPGRAQLPHPGTHGCPKSRRTHLMPATFVSGLSPHTHASDMAAISTTCSGVKYRVNEDRGHYRG